MTDFLFLDNFILDPKDFNKINIVSISLTRGKFLLSHPIVLEMAKDLGQFLMICARRDGDLCALKINYCVDLFSPLANLIILAN